MVCRFQMRTLFSNPDWILHNFLQKFVFQISIDGKKDSYVDCTMNSHIGTQVGFQMEFNMRIHSR